MRTRVLHSMAFLALALAGPALGASSHEDRYDPAVAFDGTNYLVVWQDRRPGASFDIYASRVSEGGAVLDPLGIPVSKAVGNQWAPAVAFDGTNFVVAWQDDRSTSTGPNVYGGRVSPAGILLDPGGIPISTAPGAQLMPAVARAGANSLVVWTEGGAASDIRGARVSPAGAVLDPAGLSVSAAAGAQLNPAVAFGTSSSLVVWEDYRTGPSADLYSARVTEAGALLDPAGLAIAAGPDHERNGAVAFDGAGFLVAWDGYAAGAGSDVLARRVSTGGALLGSGSVAVAASAGSQARPALAFDGANFLAAWQDDRASVFDIHAVRLSPAGVVLAPVAAISTAAQAQLGGALAHGTTGSLAVWEDRRAGPGMSDIVGTRVTPSGAALDPAGVLHPDDPRPARAADADRAWSPGAADRTRGDLPLPCERSGIELPVPPRSRRLALLPLSEDLPWAGAADAPLPGAGPRPRREPRSLPGAQAMARRQPDPGAPARGRRAQSAFGAGSAPPLHGAGRGRDPGRPAYGGRHDREDPRRPPRLGRDWPPLLPARVSSGPVSFRVVLANPSTVNRMCAPLITGGIYSCGMYGRAVLERHALAQRRAGIPRRHDEIQALSRQPRGRPRSRPRAHVVSRGRSARAGDDAADEGRCALPRERLAARVGDAARSLRLARVGLGGLPLGEPDGLRLRRGPVLARRIGFVRSRDSAAVGALRGGGGLLGLAEGLAVRAPVSVRACRLALGLRLRIRLAGPGRRLTGPATALRPASRSGPAACRCWVARPPPSGKR